MKLLERNIFSASAFAAIGRVLSAILSFLISVMLVRILSTQQMAIYFLLLSLVSFISLIGQFGLNQSVVRFVAQARANNNINQAYSIGILVFCLGIVSATICSFIYFLGCGYLGAENIFNSDYFQKTAVITSLWIFFLVMQALSAETYRGFNNIPLAVWNNGLCSALLSCLSFAVLWYLHIKIAIDQVILILVFSVAVSTVTGYFYFLFKGLPYLSREYLNPKKIIKTSIPILITNALVFILNQSAVWIVGVMQTASDVALYGVANRFLILFSFVSSLLYAVLPPVIVELHTKGDYLTLEKTLRRAATINGAIMLPVLFLIVFFSENILAFAFGEEYVAASNILIALALGSYVNIATGMRGYLLMVTGHEKTLLLVTLYSVLLTLFMCVCGAYLWGVIGIAWGVCIGIILQCLFELRAVKSKLGITTVATLSLKG